MDGLIESLRQPVVFLTAGSVILGVGLWVMARGEATRPSNSFFQVSLALALYVVVGGSLVEGGSDPASLRTTADLTVLFGLLVATTAYQFVTFGLGLGPEPSGPRERHQGVILMWGISAAVGILLAAGQIRLAAAAGPPADGDPVIALRWPAIPVVVATAAGLLSAGLGAWRGWRAAPVAERARRAGWVLAGLGAVSFLPLGLHLPLPGGWGLGTATVVAALGAVAMAGVAGLEPLASEAVTHVTGAVLHAVRGPGLLVTRNGTIHGANEAFGEAFDRDPEGLVGKSIKDLVEEVEGSRLPLAELSLDDDEKGRKVRVRSGTKEMVPARVTASALGHSDGDALSSLFLFLPKPRDGRATAATGPLDRCFRNRFVTTVPAIAVVDLGDNRFVNVNDQFLTLTGYARDELLGTTAQELGLAVEPERWEQLVRGIRDAGQVEEMEFELRRGGGGVQHAEFHGVAISAGESPEALVLARDLTARKAAEKDLRDQALYDSLTGLPNRVLFGEQLNHALQRAQRFRHRVGVLFIDLDGFKEVNDTYGHGAGDQVLAGVAWRLYECFRQMDILCRYGGDEFLVLLEDLEEVRGATAAADRFRRYLEAPFLLEEGDEVRVGATIGIAVSVPGQTEADDLIRWADVAMYRAKRKGASPIHVYDPERDAGEMERLSQADELRQAIERQELSLVYQPLVSLSTSRIVGAEALVRWPGAPGEPRTPDEFLPLAEETGLIIPMSEWIFREAARRAHRWREHLPDFKMSVNVAAQHFREASLRDTLRDVLNEVGIPAAALQLEITESAALRDARSIDRLRDLGVRVTVDDFGTGYSSLEYIRGLDVDGVKIDRVFIDSLSEDPKDQAIVKAVLLMADAFDLEVTAEGIETRDQLEWLRETGCQLGQGYLFGRPCPPEELEEMLRAGGRIRVEEPAANGSAEEPADGSMEERAES